MNNSHYKINIFNNKRYITFPILEHYNLSHCLTTIDSFKNGNPMDIKFENDYKEIDAFLASENKQRFFSHQVHGDNIEIIRSSNLGENGALGRIFPESDGLIGNTESGILLTKYADCTPVIIFDKNTRSLGTIHSGWKGTLLQISKKAVNLMISELNSQVEDLIVVLGPSIGYFDFEVKSDVFQEFVSVFGEGLMKKHSMTKGENHFIIDIPSLIKSDLMNIGILENNIYTSDISTYSTEYLHSFRRDKNHSGRMVLACSI